MVAQAAFWVSPLKRARTTNDREMCGRRATRPTRAGLQPLRGKPRKRGSGRRFGSDGEALAAFGAAGVGEADEGVGAGGESMARPPQAADDGGSQAEEER